MSLTRRPISSPSYVSPFTHSLITFVLTRLQFKFAQNPETRKRAHESYEARLAINVPLLDKALELRRKIASLLGYKTWADYITEVKMIKTAKGVDDVRFSIFLFRSTYRVTDGWTCSSSPT